MPFYRLVCWVALLMGAVPVLAQEQEEKHLDTQPQDIYNATTTLFTTQEDIQYNQKDYRAVADDMSISGLHRFTFVQKYGNKLQNLGNNGTASKSIFYIIPKDIGLTSGFHAYDIYFRSPDQFRYYDTQSPYSKMYIMLARFGSFYADVCHSRNVTPHWNIGINFRNMMTDKEWIPSNRNDKNVISHGLDLFTHYKTEGEQYQLLAHYLIAKHRVRETGGIYTPRYAKSNDEQAFWKHNMQNRLQGGSQGHPESSDARKRFHLYHQFALTEQLWTYQELEIQKNKYQFTADPLHERTKTSLGGRKTDTQQVIKDTTTVGAAHHELGIKGDWRNFFYCGYYRYKKIEFELPKGWDNLDLDEQYIGLRTRYSFGDGNHTLQATGEYLWPEFYKVRAAYEGALVELACEQIRHKPSFVEQSYHGYHRNWNKHYTPPTATQIRGGFKLANSKIQLRPYASWTRIHNHIYFKHKSEERHAIATEPTQAEKHADIATLSTDLGLALGRHIRWDSELTIAGTLGPNAHILNVPTLLANSRLYYTDTTATGNGTFEAGIDMHWKSSYKADAYDPVTQQFYLQNEFNAYSYPVIDLFLNFRIENFSAFIKFSHCNEFWLSPAPGYFVTPLYPGQKKALDIGLNWSFFD